MPVIRVRKQRLSTLVGGIPEEELKEALFNLKAEVEEEGEYYAIEVNPDRPDMYIGEGIARALKGFLGEELGYEKPPVVEGNVVLKVFDVPSRPYVAAAVVKNVNIDEAFLEELIQFQEKLHDGIGRKRRKVAIGLHDFDKLQSLAGGGPVEVEYKFLPVDSVVFAPLGSEREVKASEVLASSKQGREYGGISLREGRHPFLLVGGKVISMPPVINANYTALEPGTSHVFIDVTGTDAALVSKTLDLIVSNLAERPGAVVSEVIVAPGGAEEASVVYPRLETKSLELPVSEASRILGFKVEAEEVEELLLRARHQAEAISGELVEVEVPPFRVDVLGTIDLIEDIAMMRGIGSIEPRYEPPRLRGSVLPEVRLTRQLRLLALGLGFTEVLQLILTSPRVVKAIGMEGVAVTLENPVQEEYSVLRPSIAATLLQTLAANQHAEKPVKVFEVGEVVYKSGESVEEDLRLGLAVMDDSVSFEDVQAPVYAILRVLGVSFTAEPFESPLFIPGRAAALVNPGVGEFAWLGDVNPGILTGLGFKYPVALAEISIGKLARIVFSR
ncbi:phenylalanine--tRNA ligase subunit beta [Stetteria hydrogenophila]